jgi:hypothetical protein
MARRLRFFMAEVEKVGLPVKAKAIPDKTWEFDELEVGVRLMQCANKGSKPGKASCLQ